MYRPNDEPSLDRQVGDGRYRQSISYFEREVGRSINLDLREEKTVTLTFKNKEIWQ